MAGGGLQPGCAIGGCAGISMVVMFMLLLSFAFLGGPEGNTADANEAGSKVSDWTGSSDTVSSIDFKANGKNYSAKMPATSGKVGHEQHAAKEKCFKSGNTHYDGPLSFFSSIGTVTNCMAFGAPRTTDQERWYFNMRWDTSSPYPNNVKHLKVIITNPNNGKRIVASIEEYGPAKFLETRDGINSGASPEVYKYLGLASPYTGHPDDKNGFAEFGFAKDQDIPLGPLN